MIVKQRKCVSWIRHAVFPMPCLWRLERAQLHQRLRSCWSLWSSPLFGFGLTLNGSGNRPTQMKADDYVISAPECSEFCAGLRQLLLPAVPNRTNRRLHSIIKMTSVLSHPWYQYELLCRCHGSLGRGSKLSRESRYPMPVRSRSFCPSHHNKMTHFQYLEVLN